MRPVGLVAQAADVLVILAAVATAVFGPLQHCLHAAREATLANRGDGRNGYPFPINNRQRRHERPLPAATHGPRVVMVKG